MKKVFAFLLICALTLSLAACDMDLDSILGRDTPNFEKVDGNVSSDKMISFAGTGDVGDGDVTIIYKSDGNGNMSVVIGDKKDEDSEDELVENITDSNAIVGQWMTAQRYDSCISTSFYCFESDGTFYSTDCEYVHSTANPELFPDFEDGWYSVPMGYPASYGTYEVDGNNLILSYTHEDNCEPYEEPIVYTVTIYSLSNEGIVLGDVWGEGQHKYLKYNSDTDFLEVLCDYLDIDMTP